MIKIAFKQTFKSFVINFILLFIYTNALAGAIISFGANTYQTNNGIIFSNKINLEIICLIIIFLTYLIEKVCKNLKYYIKNNTFIYSTTLIYKNKKLTINAYLDTGNLINFKGEPVMILDLESYLKLTKSSIIDFYLSKSEQISVSTVSGSKTIKIFKIDKILIKNNNQHLIKTNQYIGVTSQHFNDANYRALLSPMHL